MDLVQYVPLIAAMFGFFVGFGAGAITSDNGPLGRERVRKLEEQRDNWKRLALELMEGRKDA